MLSEYKGEFQHRFWSNCYRYIFLNLPPKKIWSLFHLFLLSNEPFDAWQGKNVSTTDNENRSGNGLTQFEFEWKEFKAVHSFNSYVFCRRFKSFGGHVTTESSEAGRMGTWKPRWFSLAEIWGGMRHNTLATRPHRRGSWPRNLYTLSKTTSLNEPEFIVGIHCHGQCFNGTRRISP